MLSVLQTALTDPESFFDREAVDPSLRGPIVIVSVVALTGLLSSLPVFQAIMDAVPEAASAFVLIGLVVGAVIGLVGPFVVWLLYALLFYGLSAIFGGEGEFRDVFVLIGWGFAPNILSGIVGGVVTFFLVSRGDFSDPQQVQQFARSASTGPLGLLNRGFSLLMTLWSAWIWTHAVAAARNLTLRDAAISVGIVVLAGILVGLASSFLI